MRKAVVVRRAEQARRSIAAGVDLSADLAASSIGPAGRAVLVGRSHAGPLMLRGGYMIVRELESDQPGERTGFIAMRDLGRRMLDDVGDGTASAILLARALFGEIRRALASGLPQAALSQVLQAQAERIAAELGAARYADGDGSRSVAVRAAGGDAAIGALVADACDRAGEDGVVLIDGASSIDDALDFAHGLHFEEGWLSPHLVDDQLSQTLTLEKPLILIHHGAIESLASLTRPLEMIAASGRSLLIVADAVGEEAMSTLIINKRRAGLRIAAIKSPGAGLWRMRLLDDLAVATGGEVISPVLGSSLEALRPTMLGQAASVTVSRSRTTIVGGKGDPSAVAARAAEIRHAIEAERYLSFDRDQHRQRLARLNGGIAKLRIGGRTETEQQQREAAATRALAALRAARRDGVAAGGSAALIHAGRRAEAALGSMPLERAVARIMRNGLRAPTAAICGNAGVDGIAIACRLESEPDHAAYDVETRRFVSAQALIEPIAVASQALRSALSTAIGLASVEICVSESA